MKKKNNRHIPLLQKTYLLFLCICALAFLLAGCSETKHLAEGELLYVGIKRINYDDHQPVPLDTARQKGVITALGDAYNTVNSLLQSGATEAAPAQVSNTDDKMHLDSLRNLQRQDRQNYDLARAEVEAVLAKAPNNSLLGSSYYRIPLPIGLWIYNRHVNRSGRYHRWMMNNFAANPVYLTTVNPRVRSRVAQNTLRNFGYFRAQTSFDTIPQKHPKKAKVSYSVHPGPLFRLDTIAYQQFTGRADSLVRATLSKGLLKQGAPFSVQNLDAERTRLSNVFRDHGYFYFQPSYITFRADTIMRPLHVQLQVRPSTAIPAEAKRPYYIGNTHIKVYDTNDRELVDSLSWGAWTYAFSGRPSRPVMKPVALLRMPVYHRGQLYNQTYMNFVQSAVGNMGIFSQQDFKLVPRDTMPDNDTLDVYLTLRLDKPYDAELRAGVANKSNGLLGPGVNFSMSRINAFRGAEKVTLDLHGSYEWMTGAQSKGKSQVINSYEYGAELQLQFPRITLLGLFPKINRKAYTSTTYQLSANWLNRSGYYGQVNFSSRIAYAYQRSWTRKHELTLFRLDYNQLLHTSDKYNEIINQNPALYVSMRDQLVPSMQYAFTYQSSRRARNPFTFTFDVKEAGNLTASIYKLAGQPWNRTGKKLVGVPFSQFVRLQAQFVDRIKLGSTRTYLVGRLLAGTVISYGNTTMAPYVDLFSIGGANSLRAFGVRTIGPGSYRPENSKYSYIDQVGDLKLEANLEYRFPIVGDLHGAVFADAGNVWLLKSDKARPDAHISARRFGREIALGTGFGLRYDLDFLVIRFDVGVGIHAPYDTGKRGYYNMPKFWDSLGYHIAVGYPF